MRLSIITVNYNNCAGLKKTIDSVLSQTWKDFEWIVIDGGSTDGSRELIEQHKECFSYWCSEPDKGVYNAMNKGIAHAKGEYLNFMNSGDVFYAPDTLERVFSQEHTADMVYGDWVRETDESVEYMSAPHALHIMFFYNSNICHQAMFIKCSVLKSEGYDETYMIYADWARWQKMMFQYNTFEKVPVVVCQFDARGGLSERAQETLNIERKRLMEEYPEVLRIACECFYNNARRLKLYEQSEVLNDIRELMYSSAINSRLFHCISAIMICFNKLLKVVK